ncbi:MAG: alpha-L-arabinofuranosidase C-terminal domain-containing protein [Treponema sp.]|nr:alpha-L-arabinofuranosidase C-terminal domain-containing protein [Treponema sp.]
MSQNKLNLSDTTSKKITPDMVGLFFEDINFAADGGLYAELIENRSFEAVKSKGENHNYILREDNLYAWDSNCNKAEKLEISINSAVSGNNPHYLRFTADAAGEGFTNKAYDGISLVKGMKYKISYYAREVNYPEGKITVSVKKAGKTCGSVTVDFDNGKNPPKEWMDTINVVCDTKEWKQYTAELTADDSVQGALFEIALTAAGCVEFDLISMIPEDAVAGVFRKDLFEALKGLKPSFLRFPGGCIVEGTSIQRRYYWKNTVGELKNRKINTNLWGEQGGNTIQAWETQDCHYMQSYGIGFYEYFLLCELLSSDKRICRPLPVLNIGVSCQFRTYEVVPMDAPEFQDYIQDALDLIEFANGPVTSRWGAVRAKMGHPESFNLELVAIGNEQWESGAVDLAPRYKAFEKAIHQVYPEIKCLGTAGPFINHPFHTRAWDFYRDECKKNPKFAFAVDEHYYVEPDWLFDNTDFYDNYSREVAVFAGEYAGHDANLSNSVESALAEAAMMTGMERNGDVVKFASYAPLFNRIGHSQWTPDLIWFDADKVIFTPNYYVQQLFSEYSGTETLELNNQEKELRKNGIYISVVKNGNKKILKVVNRNATEQELELNITGEAQVITLKAKNGMAHIPAPTAAVDTSNGQKVIKAGVMSNAKLCELRSVEASTVDTQTVKLDGKILLPAKSFVVIKY